MFSDDRLRVAVFERDHGINSQRTSADGQQKFSSEKRRIMKNLEIIFRQQIEAISSFGLNSGRK